jgi:hypothetical protein
MGMFQINANVTPYLLFSADSRDSRISDGPGTALESFPGRPHSQDRE